MKSLATHSKSCPIRQYQQSRVGFPNTKYVFPSGLDDPIIKKQLQLGHFEFLVILHMTTGDFKITRASQLSYHRQGTSTKSATMRFLIPPSGSFKEVSLSRVRTASSFFTLRQLTHTENITLDGQKSLAIIATIVSRALTRSFLISSSGKLDTHLVNLVKNLRSL